MNKKLCNALAATLLTFAASHAAAEVKIGFMGTLSGPAAALGQDQHDGFMLAVAIWGPDLPGAANARFTAAFEEKYGRIPSQWAAQGYDAAQLIGSALAKTKGQLGDKAAFRAALAQADFDSVRGNFKFGRNGFPIQDLHVFKVARDAKGRVSLETHATPLPGLQDAYVNECPSS